LAYLQFNELTVDVEGYGMIYFERYTGLLK